MATAVARQAPCPPQCSSAYAAHDRRPLSPSPAPDPDQLRHRLTRIRSVDYCGHGAVFVATEDMSHVALVPIRCKSWRCPICGPKYKQHWAAKIAAAEPERFITLSCDAKRFADPNFAYRAMKRAWPRLIRLLREKVSTLEFVAIWEACASGYPHIHVLQKGAYIPQKLIAAMWDKLGIGYVVDIRSVYTRAGAARYVAKYVTKCQGEDSFMPLRHRLITYSRGFFPEDPEPKEPLLPGYTRKMHFHALPATLLEILVINFGFAPSGEFSEDFIELWHPAGPPSENTRIAIFDQLHQA